MIVSRLEASLSRAARGPLFASPDGHGGGGTTTDDSSTDATSGAEQEGASAGFRPITSEAELSAWKESTRKHLLTEARRTAEAEAQRKADEDAAKQKGEWEALAAQRAERISELERVLAEREAADLRRTIAGKHQLPELFADLLKGDDAAALEAHAKELAKHVKPPVAADTESGTGSRTSASGKRVETASASVGELPHYSFLPRNAKAWPTS